MGCLSHSDKYLINHLNNVRNIGLKLFDNKTINFSVPREEIRIALEQILFYHDFGKSTKYFQEYLKANIEEKEFTGDKKLTSHSLISACICAYRIAQKLSKSQFALLLSIIGFLVIRKHHGNFESLDEMLVVNRNQWNELEKQWENIEEDFQDEINNYRFEEVKDFIEDLLWESNQITGQIENYLLLNILFSILTYSDKTEVIFGEAQTNTFPVNISEFIRNYKIRKFEDSNTDKINLLREDAFQTVSECVKIQSEADNIFSLNLPTGAGKTLTVLNLAFQILNQDKNLQRIIYALPFTSIVDQTEMVLKEIFNENNSIAYDYLIIHHHLAETKVKTDEAYIEGDKAEFLIENWDKPIILTTFWQLFHSIISNKNSQLRKFHNITNSVIILDEVQTIPYKYWTLVNHLFKKFSEIFHCKIIFLTATMPLIFDETQGEIIPLVPEEKRNNYFHSFSRYFLNIVQGLEDMDMDQLIEHAAENIKKNPEKSFLFVFNTIASSIEFFNSLKEIFPEEEIIYLSTNILPVDRKKRINLIKNRSRRQLVVSTQVIEAGVDIDLDIVYRDVAPLDSLIQTAGRCNRHSKQEKGRVYIFKFLNNRGKYDFSYIYSGLAMNTTLELLSQINQEIEEKKLLNVIHQYYLRIKENSSQDDSRELLDYIKNLAFEDIGVKFRLIDNFPTFQIFLAVNEEAQELLSHFKNLLAIHDRFERKSELLKIKADFYQYILSVRYSENMMNYANSFETIGDLRIVQNEDIVMIYDKDTGLIRKWSVFI